MERDCVRDAPRLQQARPRRRETRNPNNVLTESTNDGRILSLTCSQRPAIVVACRVMAPANR